MAKRPLYIFNPEHDLALASGEANYMAPASARQMAADLALLPIWYAGKEAAVLAPSAYTIEFLKAMEGIVEVCGGFVTAPELASKQGFEFIPWGWNPALRKRLLSLGASESQLPSTQYMEWLRRYSHRSQAVALLPKLQINDFFCGESSYLKTAAEWQSFVEGHSVCVLKAPLSGSGKGLNWCKGEFTSFISGWCSRVAATQGGVIGEPIYNKVKDFAMEFYSDGAGNLSFVGYSLFRTGGSGMYDGNYLLSNERILEILSAYVPVETFSILQSTLVKELFTLLGTAYKGFLGVDMMLCQFPGERPEFRIHPCVEINLRMNMGVVARCLSDRFLAPGAEGSFRIMYYPQEGEALKEHQRMNASFPLHVQNGCISSGYLPLVPVTPYSRYRAWVEVLL